MISPLMILLKLDIRIATIVAAEKVAKTKNCSSSPSIQEQISVRLFRALPTIMSPKILLVKQVPSSG
jgi:hypothetical protein